MVMNWNQLTHKIIDSAESYIYNAQMEHWRMIKRDWNWMRALELLERENNLDKIGILVSLNIEMLF